MSECSLKWIDELSVDRYRPMMRLLDRADFDFLRAQPGVTSRQIARLRTQRCRIVRGYLRSLSADFEQVSMALKLLIAKSQEDRPDLARLLLRRQALFACSMIRVHLRLTLYSWGLSQVDVSGPLRLFDGMRLELASMAPDAA